jgi:hypothetical protein
LSLRSIVFRPARRDLCLSRSSSEFCDLALDAGIASLASVSKRICF